jgi:hypothetical protein
MHYRFRDAIPICTITVTVGRVGSHSNAISMDASINPLGHIRRARWDSVWGHTCCWLDSQFSGSLADRNVPSTGWRGRGARNVLASQALLAKSSWGALSYKSVLCSTVTTGIFLEQTRVSMQPGCTMTMHACAERSPES